MPTQQPENNPVVLLSEGRWHIVESSRGSSAALCGRPIRDRQAHSRLRTIGRENACPQCLREFDRVSDDHP